MENIIKIWKDLGINEAQIQFDCGGDSMGSMDIAFSDTKGKKIKSPELESYFLDSVYEHIEFYVNSDGHYQGESGTVNITFEEEGEYFEYTKDAQAEFSETHTSETYFELSEKAISFIKENVSNINGSQDGAVINFKRDLILSEKDEELITEIEEFIVDKTNNYCPDLEIESEWDEWFSFTTNDEGEQLIINDNKLKVQMSNQYIKYEISD